MPRSPDAECAGGCGRMLWGGRTSLPAGVRCCRNCRIAGLAPVPVKLPGTNRNRTCETTGCERKHAARGMCNVHYKRWRREQGLDSTNPVAIIGGLASLHGAYFPKPKPIKVRITVGVIAQCPWCDNLMGATDPIHRACRSCGTTVVLNAEEVSWVIYEKRSIAA